MILDRTHRFWAILSAAILIVATVIFVREAAQSPHGVTGGSLIGLAFGIVGSAFMIFAGLLAARKRVPTWRIGSAQFWLRGHIWLGLLSVPLILFHSGFGWGGLLENLLWITFVVVIVSGLYGLAVQHLLPRWITVRVPDETFGEQVPHRCRWLLVESDKLVAELSGRLDVPVDGLRGVAFDLAYGLGKLRNGKEEEDIAKFLSAIYVTSNGDSASGGRKPSEDVVPPKNTSGGLLPPLATAVVGVPASGGADVGVLPSGGVTPAEAGTPTPATASQPADKPLSKIEQMRAAAAAKKAAAATSPREGEAPAEPPTPPSPTAPASGTPVPAATLSKIEQMRAAAAAKKAAAATAAPPREGEAPAEPPSPPSPTVPASGTPVPASTLSKIEQMRAAAAAKKAAAATSAPPREGEAPAEPPSTIGGSSVSAVASQPGPSTGSQVASANPPLSKIEQMRAAAAAKKAQAAGAAPAPTAPSVARRTAPEASPPSTLGATGGSSASAVASRPEPGTGRQAASATQAIPRADEVRAFYFAEVRPFLDDRSRCRGPLGAETRSRGMFAQLRASLAAELHPALEHLENSCDQRRQFERQRTLHRWLHGWLLVHIPATLVLLVLFVAHVVMALRVVPWSWTATR